MAEIVRNSETGDVTVPVVTASGTREYTLKLSMNASVQLQKRRKQPLGEIVKDFTQMNAESMIEILFVLLQRHHALEIKTHEQAGDVLTDMGPRTFFAAFQSVMEHGAPEGAADTANPPKAAANPTGDGSTSIAAG
jgi:hypothetical protein